MEHGFFFLILLLGRLTNSLNNKISSVVSCLVPLASVPVSLNLFDIVVCCFPVSEQVLGNDNCKFSWVGEFLSPNNKFLDVSFDFLALSEVGWQLLNDLSDFHNALDNVVEISFLNVSDGICDFLLKSALVLEAFLNVRKVVFANESVDKSGNKLFNSMRVDVVSSGNDGCKCR